MYCLNSTFTVAGFLCLAIKEILPNYLSSKMSALATVRSIPGVKHSSLLTHSDVFT